MATNEPPQEQVFRLLDWCGFTILGVVPVGVPEGSLWPEIDMTGFSLYPGESVARPTPILGLDLIYDHVIPTLFEKGYNVECYSFEQFEQGSGYYYSEVNIWRKGTKEHSVEVLHDENVAKTFWQGSDLKEITALAYFWSALKVIEKEENHANDSAVQDR